MHTQEKWFMVDSWNNYSNGRSIVKSIPVACVVLPEVFIYHVVHKE